ncbi:MAG: ATP-binding cassette domain-containing protein [Anaerotruncus massiliensis (ex Togo et al. 2019)]
MEDVILEVKGMCKYFGSLVANEDINMTVKRASVHSIIGENGAGKSTLMNMIAGIYKPSKGEVFVNGKVVPQPQRRGEMRDRHGPPGIHALSRAYGAGKPHDGL